MRSSLLHNNSLAFGLKLLWIMFGATVSFAQTSSITYQGRLTEGGSAANGNYDLQVTLFDSLSGGGQVGSTQTLSTVGVSNGIFTVSLDFGANAFPGASRFLEISARPSGAGAFTLLAPRQPITSTPYAVRSLNAASADSVPASGVPAGSGNYIQNSSSSQAANFSISGNGTAGGTLSGGVVNSTTQFNLNGSRILSNSGINNLFVGTDVGTTNATGNNNIFIGHAVGSANTTGSANAFFGSFAGEANTEGQRNSFFGSNAGRKNTTGDNNSFFGSQAGRENTDGLQNAFFGDGAGLSNTTGSFNSFFGLNSGAVNTTGSFNSYLGQQAGVKATGSSNTFVGAFADFAIVADISPSGNRNTLLGSNSALGSGGMFSPDNATAIGANARVDQANSLVLGSIKNINGATADTNVGIGTTAPTARLSVVATGDGARVLHLGTERAWVFRQLGTGAASALELTGDDPNNNNKNFLITTTGFVGIGTTAPNATLSVNGSASKPGGGSWATFSDERLKTIKGRFTSGLKALMQLQPLRYEYKRVNALNLKSEGEHVGFSAQAVKNIIPEAVTSTEQGYLLVNNDPILWTMLNAIKEQQDQIQQQRELIDRQRSLAVRQQQDLNALKKLACRTHRRASICR